MVWAPYKEPPVWFDLSIPLDRDPKADPDLLGEIISHSWIGKVWRSFWRTWNL